MNLSRADKAVHALLQRNCFFVAYRGLRKAGVERPPRPSACTLYLILIARGAGEVAERALKEGLGEDYMDRIDPDLAARFDPSIPWARLLLPFRMGLPEVERVKNIAYGPYGRRNRLDVYRHKDHPTACPTLLQMHGGGRSGLIDKRRRT